MRNIEFMDDQILVNGFLQGNSRMMDILIRKYESRVYGYIYSEIPDKAVCSDLFQETFIKAMLSLRSGSYIEQGKFASWLMRIAHNLIMDYFRGGKNRHAFARSLDDLYFEPAYDEKSPEDQIVFFTDMRKDSVEMIKDMLKELPPEQEELIILKIYENKTHREIAALKNISINTSLGRYRYAITNLRKAMAKNHYVIDVDLI